MASSTLPPGASAFTGHGRAGDWSDPNNWSNGAPGANTLALVQQSAVENGAFTAKILMLLGQEQVTFNGAVATTSTGECSSMMVCEGATATFTATSSLTDPGGLIVGNDGQGAVIAQGSAGGQHATLHVSSLKVGKDADATGAFTVNGAVLHDDMNAYVGESGIGSMVVENGGQVSVGGTLHVGAAAGAHGTLMLASGGSVTVAGDTTIGMANPNGTGGLASLSVGAGSTLSTGGDFSVAPGCTVTLTGGTIHAGGSAGMQFQQGAQVSGAGTLSAAQIALFPGATLTASGGTLAVQAASIGGNGTLAIGANSTAVLTAAAIGNIGIAFTGAHGALDLAHGVNCTATIADFAAGDTILMQGVDAISWDGTHDMLTLTDHGAVVDRLHFSGSFGANPFTFTQTSAGGLIGHS